MPVAIELIDGERARLEAWRRRRTSAQASALRSRIVLAAAENLSNTKIARAAGRASQRRGQVAPALAWTKTADQILDSNARCRTQIDESRH